MSDIWHTTKEKPMLHRDIILCGDGWSMAIDIIPETVNNICWKNVEKWCYIDDLLALEAELERTRKALEIAWDGLKRIKEPSVWGTLYQEQEIATEALDESKTALEQKESAFVHNKIEFPEFNDNLLEEFDKQFFENGQDDDLTETALEQKDVK